MTFEKEYTPWNKGKTMSSESSLKKSISMKETMKTKTIGFQKGHIPKHKGKHSIITVCEGCKQSFIAKSSRYKYCSRACYSENIVGWNKGKKTV